MEQTMSWGGSKGQTRREAGTQSPKSRSIEFVEFIEFIGLQAFNPTDPKNSKNPTNRDGSAAETSKCLRAFKPQQRNKLKPLGGFTNEKGISNWTCGFDGSRTGNGRDGN